MSAIQKLKSSQQHRQCSERTSPNNANLLNKSDQLELFGRSKRKAKDLNISDHINTSQNRTLMNRSDPLNTSSASSGFDISANQGGNTISIGNLLDQYCDDLFKQQTRKPNLQDKLLLQRKPSLQSKKSLQKKSLRRKSLLQEQTLLHQETFEPSFEHKLNVQPQRESDSPRCEIINAEHTDNGLHDDRDSASAEMIVTRQECHKAFSKDSDATPNVQEETDKDRFCESFDKVKNVIIDLNRRSSSRLRSKLKLKQKQSKLDQFMLKTNVKGSNIHKEPSERIIEHGTSALNRVHIMECAIKQNPSTSEENESQDIVIIDEINETQLGKNLSVDFTQHMNKSVSHPIMSPADDNNDDKCANETSNPDIRPVYWKNVQINELEFIYRRRRRSLSKTNQGRLYINHKSKRKNTKIDNIVIPSQEGVKMKVCTSGIYLERNVTRVKQSLKEKKKHQGFHQVRSDKQQKLKRKSSESSCHLETRDNKRYRNQTPLLPRPVAVCKPYYTRSDDAPRAAKQKCQEKIKDLSFEKRLDLKGMYHIAKIQKEKTVTVNKSMGTEEKCELDEHENDDDDDLVCEDNVELKDDPKVENELENADIIDRRKKSGKNLGRNRSSISDNAKVKSELEFENKLENADTIDHQTKAGENDGRKRSSSTGSMTETKSSKSVEKLIVEHDWRFQKSHMNKTVLNLPAFRLKISNQKSNVNPTKYDKALDQNVKGTKIQKNNKSKNVIRENVNRYENLNHSKNVKTTKNVKIIKNVTHPVYEPTPGRRPTVVHSLGGLAEKDQELGKNFTLSRGSLGPLFCQLKPAQNVILDSDVNLL